MAAIFSADMDRIRDLVIQVKILVMYYTALTDRENRIHTPSGEPGGKIFGHKISGESPKYTQNLEK